MTATPTRFAPPNALNLWADSTTIYVEFPGPGEGSTVLTYPHNSLGLSRIIELLGVRKDLAGAPIPAIDYRRVKRVGTSGQHAAAEALLRAKGFIR